MGAAAIPLAISVGGGLLNTIFGSDDEFKMSDQQKFLFDKILKESGQFQGLSLAEKEKIVKGLREQTNVRAEEDVATTTESLRRRGSLRGGQAGGIFAKIKGEAGRGFGEGVGQIESANLGVDRSRRMSLLKMLGPLSQGQFVPGQGLPGLEGIGMDLSTLLNPPEEPQDNFASILELLQN